MSDECVCPYVNINHKVSPTVGPWLYVYVCVCSILYVCIRVCTVCADAACIHVSSSDMPALSPIFKLCLRVLEAGKFQLCIKNQALHRFQYRH